MNESAYLLIILLITRIITSGVVYFNWRKTKKKSILILLIFFLISIVSLTILIIGNLILYDISFLFEVIAMLSFINQAFYQDRKSPFKILIITSLILGAFAITFIVMYEYSILIQPSVAYLIHGFLLAGLDFIFGGWTLIEAFRAFNIIKSNKAVEPWVKGRYKLVIFYSICAVLQGVVSIFISEEAKIDLATILAAVVILSRYAGETLAWTMPSFLKKYLNRGFSVPSSAKDMSEEEIMGELK